MVYDFENLFKKILNKYTLYTILGLVIVANVLIFPDLLNNKDIKLNDMSYLLPTSNMNGLEIIKPEAEIVKTDIVENKSTEESVVQPVDNKEVVDEIKIKETVEIKSDSIEEKELVSTAQNIAEERQDEKVGEKQTESSVKVEDNLNTQEKPVEIVVEKVDEKTEEKPVEIIEEKVQEKTDEKPVETVQEKTDEKPVEIVQEEVQEKTEEKPVETVQEKVQEKTEEKPVEIVQEMPVKSVEDNSLETKEPIVVIEQTEEKKEAIVEKTVDNSSENILDKAEETAEETSVNDKENKPTETTDKPVEKITDQVTIAPILSEDKKDTFLPISEPSGVNSYTFLLSLLLISFIAGLGLFLYRNKSLIHQYYLSTKQSNARDYLYNGYELLQDIE